MPPVRDEGSAIGDAAGRWFARLQAEDVTEADRRDFQAWLDADPRHRQAWAEMAGIAVMLRAAGPALAPRPLPRQRPRWIASVWATAVLLMLAIGLGAVWGPQLLATLRADQVAGSERRRIDLADGSVMNLNRDSAASLSLTATERRITLLRGEAFFEVVPDPARPFVVAFRDGQAQAVGTAFAVRLSGGATRVTVERGIVAVSPRVDGTTSQRLNAGQAAALQGVTIGPVESADLGVDTGWRHGRLSFRQRPLAEVIAALERYRPGMIVLLDRDLGRRPVTGSFDIDDTDKALRAIETVMQLKIHQVTPFLTLVSQR